MKSEEERFKAFARLCLKILASVILLGMVIITLSGCAILQPTEMQDRVKVYKINLRHPNVLPSWCATNVPVKADTVQLPPIIQTRIDTLKGKMIIVDCDTVKHERLVYVKCPGQIIKHDSVSTRYYITKVNTAAYDSLYIAYRSIEKVSNIKDGKISAKNALLWIMAGVIVALIIGLVLIIKFKVKI